MDNKIKFLFAPFEPCAVGDDTEWYAFRIRPLTTRKVEHVIDGVLTEVDLIEKAELDDEP